MSATALITGANRGIGREVARQLATRGFTVFLGCRDIASGEMAAASLSGDLRPLAIDIASPEKIHAAVQFLGAQSKVLDVLVNNAGVLFEGDSDITTLDHSLIERTLSINTLGALRVSQAFLPLLRRSSRPRIINVSSGGGQLSDGLQTWAPAYCISKTALNAVTCQLAAALSGFAVNSVCPGWVRTDMGGPSATRGVAEGADTIVWLATEAPHQLTGKFLRDRAEIPW